MKILILGNARSGKDTVAEYISDNYKFNYLPTSIYVSKNIIMPAFIGKYSDHNEAYLDRINNRKVWADLIKEYCKDDPCRLIKEIFNHSDIYCGLRDFQQLKSAQDENLFDLSIWVERTGFTEGSESMTIIKEDADIIITNNGNVSDLNKKIDKLFSLFDTFVSL